MTSLWIPLDSGLLAFWGDSSKEDGGSNGG